MRIAQRMISRNYKREINSSMSKQNSALERSESGLAFKKLSDNVASGSRAMLLQEQRYAAEQHLDNVKNLMAEQKSIDSNLSSMHSILQTIQERVLTGMSEDWGTTAREVIAKEIGEKMEQLLQFANNQYAGHTLFGGTNNSVTPFTVDEKTGKLQFNGINVEDIFKSAIDGKYYYYPSIPDPDHPESGDVAHNITIDGADFHVYGDGETFHVHGAGDPTKYTEINGVRYYTDDGVTFTSENGKSFELNNNKTGYDQVVIDGVTYTKDGDYYYGEGAGPGNVFGKVFKSDDGLNFVQVETAPVDPDDHLTMGVTGNVLEGGQSVSFSLPETKEEPLEFKLSANGGGYSQVVIGDGNGTARNYVRTGTDADGNWIYESTDPRDKSVYLSKDGLTFTQSKDDKGNDVTGTPAEYTFGMPEKILGEIKEVPNSGKTFADVGLGLKIKNSDMMADPRTAYQASFSGLDIMGCAGISYDGVTPPDPIYGSKFGTQVSGNLYDLLGQIKNALSPNLDKNALDDLFTQLVDLTDEVGMVRTDLGNRMQYLELTETRLDDDITNMTTLETDLISSNPAEEAMKMKECEYVWLALMQLGSKVLPASLLDFIS